MLKQYPQIIGVDPAPGKASCAFDGKDWHWLGGVKSNLRGNDLSDVVAKLGKLTSHESVLVCWDAPLAMSLNYEHHQKVNPLSSRPIELQLRRLPTGISTGSFSGVCHWTISQYCWGLPNVRDAQNVVFPHSEIGGQWSLVVDDEPIEKGKWLAEVHPAVGVYALLVQLGLRSQGDEWRYKGKKEYRDKIKMPQLILRLLKKLIESSQGGTEAGLVAARDAFNDQVASMGDDKIDAFVAWLMGFLWVHKGCVKLSGAEVSFYGDNGVGLLLPPLPSL